MSSLIQIVNSDYSLITLCARNGSHNSNAIPNPKWLNRIRYIFNRIRPGKMQYNAIHTFQSPTSVIFGYINAPTTIRTKYGVRVLWTKTDLKLAPPVNMHVSVSKYTLTIATNYFLSCRPAYVSV